MDDILKKLSAHMGTLGTAMAESLVELLSDLDSGESDDARRADAVKLLAAEAEAERLRWELAGANAEIGNLQSELTAAKAEWARWEAAHDSLSALHRRKLESINTAFVQLRDVIYE